MAKAKHKKPENQPDGLDSLVRSFSAVEPYNAAHLHLYMYMQTLEARMLDLGQSEQSHQFDVDTANRILETMGLGLGGRVFKVGDQAKQRSYLETMARLAWFAQQIDMPRTAQVCMGIILRHLPNVMWSNNQDLVSFYEDTLLTCVDDRPPGMTNVLKNRFVYEKISLERQFPQVRALFDQIGQVFDAHTPS